MQCSLIQESIVPVQRVYNNLLLYYLNVFISLIQTQLFRMYQRSCQLIYTIHFLSNYIPNLLKSVLIIVPSQERSMYQYFEVAGFINTVKNAICMIQSLLVQ